MDRYTKAFVVAALVYFFLAAALGAWMGSATPAGWVRFAHVHFNLLGFMSMMIYGVGYFILPRFNGRTLRWPSWVPLHFYAANVGLIGMVATAPERPSTGFALFAGLSVVSAAMFVVNLGVTMLVAPAEVEEEEEEEIPSHPQAPPAPSPPQVDIHPDMRVGEILSRWPQTVDVFVANGFASLGNPEHREQVKQIPGYPGRRRRKGGAQGKALPRGTDPRGEHPGRHPLGLPGDREGVPEVLRRRVLLLPRPDDRKRQAERDDAQREREADPVRSEPGGRLLISSRRGMTPPQIRPRRPFDGRVPSRGSFLWRKDPGSRGIPRTPSHERSPPPRMRSHSGRLDGGEAVQRGS
jgi:hypothetical protein